MTRTVTRPEALQHFEELLSQIEQENAEILILDDGRVVARLSPGAPARRERIPGSAKGIAFFMAADFDATPEGFEEYTP